MSWDDRPSRSDLAAWKAEEWIIKHPDDCLACLGTGVVNLVNEEFGIWGDPCSYCEGTGKWQCPDSPDE